jgi:hypothetical protein
MQNYKGRIGTVTPHSKLKDTYIVTIAAFEDPNRLVTTFLIEDADLVEFFTTSEGWFVYGSIDEFGYMSTVSHEW